MMATRSQGRKGGTVNRQGWCFIPPSTTKGPYCLTNPHPLGLALLSFLTSALVLFPIFSPSWDLPMFYLTWLFCPYVRSTSTIFKWKHNRRTVLRLVLVEPSIRKKMGFPSTWFQCSNFFFFITQKIQKKGCKIHVKVVVNLLYI